MSESIKKATRAERGPTDREVTAFLASVRPDVIRPTSVQTKSGQTVGYALDVSSDGVLFATDRDRRTGPLTKTKRGI
jgi:hypothetical protein